MRQQLTKRANYGGSWGLVQGLCGILSGLTKSSEHASRTLNSGSCTLSGQTIRTHTRGSTFWSVPANLATDL